MTGGPGFFDFQVAAPKSVSIMSMFDKRLLEAHREAVDTAMGELENLAAVLPVILFLRCIHVQTILAAIIAMSSINGSFTLIRCPFKLYCKGNS